jgi:hypothetical protein
MTMNVRRAAAVLLPAVLLLASSALSGKEATWIPAPSNATLTKQETVPLEKAVRTVLTYETKGDVNQVRSALTRRLKAAGFQVFEAPDGTLHVDHNGAPRRQITYTFREGTPLVVQVYAVEQAPAAK